MSCGPSSVISGSTSEVSTTWPRPVSLAGAQRDHDRERGRERGDAVGERERRQERRAVGLAVQRGEAAHRLGERAEAGAPRVRPGLAEAAHARDHEPRVRGRQLVRAGAPALERAGPEVLEHDVRALGEAQEEVAPVGLREVERDEPLVAPERLEPEPLAVLARPVPARRVDARRVLDLDHVGAVVGEEHPGERRREERRRLDDADAFERLRAHGRSTASRKPIASSAACGRRRAAASASTPAPARRRRRTSPSPRPSSRSRP